MFVAVCRYQPRRAIHLPPRDPAPTRRLSLATVGAFSHIEQGVQLDDNVQVLSHVVIRGQTRVGANSKIFSFASIGSQRKPGMRVEIGPNSSIREHVNLTGDGDDDERPIIVGSGALIMSGCEIGAGACIGNGVVIGSNTRIDAGVKIDEGAIVGGLCHVMRGSHIGRGTMVGGRLSLQALVLPYSLVDAKSANGEPTARGLNRVGLRRRRVKNDEIKLMQNVLDALYRNLTSPDQLITRAKRLALKYHSTDPEDTAKRRILEMIHFILNNQQATNRFLMK